MTDLCLADQVIIHGTSHLKDFEVRLSQSCTKSMKQFLMDWKIKE